MSRARDLADSADKDIAGTLTLDGLDVAGNVSVDNGTIKLDGNYPVGTDNVALGDTALDSLTSGSRNNALGASALTAVTSGAWNIGIGTTYHFLCKLNWNLSYSLYHKHCCQDNKEECCQFNNQEERTSRKLRYNFSSE